MSKLHIFPCGEHEDFSMNYKGEYIEVLTEFLDLVDSPVELAATA